MFISRKRMKSLEKRIADLEKKVQGQPQRLIDDLDCITERAISLFFHTLEEQPRKQ